MATEKELTLFPKFSVFCLIEDNEKDSRKVIEDLLFF
jgi:hypothetical protein